MFLYFEREKDRMSRGGAEREGDREYEADSAPSVWSLMHGSNS